MRLSLALLGGVTLLSSTVDAVNPVTRAGRYLYSGGDRFYIKGIAYQEQGQNDPSVVFASPI